MFNPKKDIVFSWRYDLFISKDQTSTQQKPHFHSGVSGKASMSEENCYLYTLYGPLRLWTPNLRSLTCGLPSGKHTENYGKSPFVMGKSTISMAMFNHWISSSSIANCQSLPEGTSTISIDYPQIIHKLSVYNHKRVHHLHPYIKRLLFGWSKLPAMDKKMQKATPPAMGPNKKKNILGHSKTTTLLLTKKISIICIYIYYEHVYYEQHILV